jgi:hypothetical protein
VADVAAEVCVVDTNICLSVTGDLMNNFMNKNFNLVLEEFGQPAFNALGMVVHQIVTALTERVPYDKLFTKGN